MDTIIKILERYGTVYMQGLAGTLWLAAITVVLGTAVGTLLAVLRLSRVRVFQWFVKAYVWVLRGTPILLQLYFFWIFLPKVMPFSLSDTACIIVALIINASSYGSSGRASRRWIRAKPRRPAAWALPRATPCPRWCCPRR